MKTTARDFAEFVEKHLEIPTIPDVAARALREMSNPRADGPRIAGIIGKDQGLTTRVLQLTNSAAFGLRRKVVNLEQAAMILGFNRLKTLVISASCRQLYRHFGWLEMELWLHSVACAAAATIIARHKKLPGASEAFVAGLMHDVGKVVMNNAEPDKFRDVVKQAEGGEVYATEPFEREAFGFTHSEVGALLIRRWELAPELESILLMHHDAELLITQEEEVQGLTWAVILADEICHREGLGSAAIEYADPLEESEAALALELDEDELESLTEQIREAFEEDRQLFK